jgi:GTP-binding protein Era
VTSGTTAFRSGVVGIVGRPNVGKSTLLNAFLGRKLSIVTPKPQTTRNKIAGILHAADHQVVFLDTPGLHEPRDRLSQAMQDMALSALQESDVLLYLVDADLARKDAAHLGPGNEQVLENLKQAPCPILLTLNKVDLVSKELLLPIMAAYRDRFPFASMVPVSATRKDGLDVLLAELLRHLPEGGMLFEGGELTDRSLAFIITEFVREKVFLKTRQEVPYSTAVGIETLQERTGPKPLLHVSATIHVEKDSQKAILVGKGGSMIREIGSAARMEIETYLGRKVFLELRVRVEKDWTRSDRGLKRVGFTP